MKALILAAGLGTRLRPWTLHHPKALVPVGGVPMLERVILKLRTEGFDEIVVNVHHFASQIVDFLASSDFGCDIKVSDESDCLLDTGGALVKALPLIDDGNDTPFLVHNVDILGNARLSHLMECNEASGAGATLLVSNRDSSRRLIFDEEMTLRGWHDLSSDVYRPEGFCPEAGMRQLAFSGIYVARPSLVIDMIEAGFREKFGVMDYFLSDKRRKTVEGQEAANLTLIDIGKPATLSQANLSFM